MPLYDYDCANCGRRFEVLRGVHADQPTVCPLCGGGPVKKAFAAPAIHFKGSGWAKKERRATASPGPSKSSRDGGSPSRDGGSSSGGDGGGSDGDRGSSGKGDDSAFLFGGYLGGQLAYEVSPGWSIAAGFQYQNLGTWQRQLGTRAVNLDLSKTKFISLSVGYSF